MLRKPTAADRELFTAAKRLLEQHHDAELHQVAAAARGADGQIYCGLHLASRRVNVCAESSAIANAVMAGSETITAIAAVCKNDSGDVIVTNPCGVCRELMDSYAADTSIMIDNAGDVTMASLDELMPHRWMFPHENDWTPNDPSISQ
jgi:cytidine deaminase